MSAATRNTGGPSDLDLMLYFDGELDPERAKEVEAYLHASSAAQQKIAGLELGASLVRERVRAREADAPDLADAIMGRLADEQPPAREPAQVVELASRKAAAQVATVHGKRAHPANDSARRIYTLAAVGIAAAAGLMLWARSESVPSRLGSNTGAGPSVALQAPTATAARPNVSAEQESPSPDQDVDVGVAVAAVDFGAQSGAIFYVPGDAAAAGHTTTVVWLADELGGGE